MAHNLRRDQIIKVLTDAGIAFDPDATMVTLRPIYDNLVENLATNQHSQEDNSHNDVQTDNFDQQQQMQQQQQQQQQTQQQPPLLQQQNDDSAQTQQQQPVLQQQRPNEEREINEQIVLLQKRRELLQLQREVESMQNFRRFDFRAFESMVNKFTGDDTYDVDKWFNDLEDAFAAFQCKPNDKLIAARSLIDGTAKVFLRTIRISTYDELKTELTTEFKQIYSAHEVYQQLKLRVKKPDESLKHYVSIMVEIASHATIPDTDLVDLIVEGLQDSSANIAMLYSAKTVAELKELLKRYEKMCRVQAKPEASANFSTYRGAIPKQTGPAARSVTKPAANTVANTAANTVVNQSASPSNTDLSSVRCYNCFKYGHYQGTCTLPKRPMNSCFICSEVGHHRNQCPRRQMQNQLQSHMQIQLQNQLQNQMPAANTEAQAVAAVEGYLGDPAAEEEEIRRLASRLKYRNIVSVAFIKHNKCSELIPCDALFDNGSPTSIVRRSLVPFVMTDDLIVTNFRGMGNRFLSTYGLVRCKIIFRGNEFIHNFLILPDNEAVVPFLIGRDLLRKMNIFLCQIVSHKYTKNDLLKLKNANKNNKLPSDLSALKMFNLLKNPLDKEPTTVGNSSKNKNKTDVNIESKVEQEVNFGCKLVPNVDETAVGCIDLNNESEWSEVENIIMLVGAIETDVSKTEFDLNENLNETDKNDLKRVIVENYMNKIGEKRLDSYSMKIKLTDDKPVYSSPRRLSYREKNLSPKNTRRLNENWQNTSKRIPICISDCFGT